MRANLNLVLRTSILALSAVLCAWPQQGSNLDPPPPPPYEEAAAATEPEPPETPFWRQVDLADPANLVKIALLVGSIVIARRAFRDMQ